MGNGDLPVGNVQYHVEGSVIICSVADHWVVVPILLEECRYDLRQIVVVLI